MNDSFNFGRRRRDYSSFFSPSKTNSSLPREYNESTPTSSRTGSVDLESIIDAIESRDADTFAEVLLRGRHIDVNQVIPALHMTLLHFSVGNSNNQPEIVEALLRRGGDPNNVNIDEKQSPLHLSAWFDYDRVMKVLVDYGGDLKVLNGDGEMCFDIVRRNVEEELMENCFKYLFPISKAFRKSIGTSLVSASQQGRSINHSQKQAALHDSGSDGFYSCESQNLGDGISHISPNNDRIQSK